MMPTLRRLLLAIATLAPATFALAANRAFTIKDNQFLLDGTSFNIRSGSIHYWRLPEAYWRDRLERLQ